MTSEAVNLKLVMLEASKLGLRVFRNNRGAFYTIDGVKAVISAVKRRSIADALKAISRLRIVRAGLEVAGSGDLIGWMPCGKIASLEVKATGGKPTKEQIIFHDNVRKAGGFACIIDDEKKLKKLVDDFYKNV